MISCERIGRPANGVDVITLGQRRDRPISLAMTDSWTNPVSGERQERTEWANFAVWNAAIGEVPLDFLKKGSRAFVEGRLETRSWEKDGKKNGSSLFGVGRNSFNRAS
jgi:single-stranded DNA-binding protein